MERTKMPWSMLQRTVDHRQARLLRVVQRGSLTVPEVAKVLGCREGTVKSRLSGSLGRLRQILSSHESYDRAGDA